MFQLFKVSSNVIILRVMKQSIQWSRYYINSDTIINSFEFARTPKTHRFEMAYTLNKYTLHTGFIYDGPNKYYYDSMLTQDKKSILLAKLELLPRSNAILRK